MREEETRTAPAQRPGCAPELPAPAGDMEHVNFLNSLED